MKNFWLHFAIQEATSIASLFVNSLSLKPEQKKALEDFIAAGQNVTTAFTAPLN
jgi:hypothetical protein